LHCSALELHAGKEPQEKPRAHVTGPSGLNVGHDEVRWKYPGRSHSLQVIVDNSGFLGSETRCDNVGLVRGRNIRVGQPRQDGGHLIGRGDLTGTRNLVGITTICLGWCDSQQLSSCRHQSRRRERTGQELSPFLMNASAAR
jgi:hypothetical protein